MVTSQDEEAKSDPVDALLHWGIATKFRYYLTEQWLRKVEGLIGLLIEWKSVDDAEKGVQIASSHKVFVPRIYRGSEGVRPRRYWAVTVRVEQAEQFINEAAPLANRINLAAPLSVSDPTSTEMQGTLVSDEEVLAATIGQEKPVCEGEVLAAVLDDGCAFANARFRRVTKKTRVLWLWNQDLAAKGVPLDEVNGPSPNCGFGFGGQWSQNHLDNIDQVELEEQEAIYVRAGLPGLRRVAAHGPHVMDLLCGAEQWPVVFIQFPLEAIDDPSGEWLEIYAVVGLDYILECAGASQSVKTVVVNLSWGPQTWSHDGSSFLESYIDQLVVEQAALGRKLIVCLAAGNSYGARAHAQIDAEKGGSVQWCVPPDGHTPAFLEVWWPKNVSLADAKLRITPPGSNPEDIDAGADWNEDNWYASIAIDGASAKAFVSINPTEHADWNSSGRHGIWTIEVIAGQAGVEGEVHVYVARADHNMGARRRAKASYLTDGALESARFVAPSQRFDEAAHSAIRRAGTLNGLATGSKSKVAAGYRYRDYEVSAYSSSGGSRGARDGPDYACVTDISAAISGVRASGVRSGTTVRLVGTSMAAPQLGRQLVNGLNPTTPGPIPPNTPQRVGAGCLIPDGGVLHKQ